MSSGKLNVRTYQLKKRYRAEQLNHDIIMDITVYTDSRVTLLMVALLSLLWIPPWVYPL